MQPTTPVLGVTGIQAPAPMVPAGSGSLETPNKRLRVDDDPLSRYDGYKHFASRNKLYYERMAQIAAEVAATLPQHLLLANEAQLQSAGVEIVMSASHSNLKFVIWPGMTVPPQPMFNWSLYHLPSAVEAMMNDESFKQVLAAVPGVKTYTPEQAEQYMAHEKDKAAAQQAQSSAAVVIRQLEDVATLIASVKQLQHAQQAWKYREALDRWSNSVNIHLESLRSTCSTVSMMVSRQAVTTEIRTFLESVTQEACNWLGEDAQRVFRESLQILQRQDSETRAHAASAETLRAEVAQLKQQVTNLEQNFTNVEQVAAAFQQREQAALVEVERLKKSNAEAEALLVNSKQTVKCALQDAHQWQQTAIFYRNRCQRLHGRQDDTHMQLQQEAQTVQQEHQQPRKEQQASS